MTSLVIRKLAPDSRLWRIDWFGDLSYEERYAYGQPSVRVALSPVVCDPSDNQAMLLPSATDHHRQCQRWIRIGYLPSLQVGDIWQNGQCHSSPQYQRMEFKSIQIVKGTTDFIKSGLSLDDSFLIPLAEHPWHRQQTGSYCISVKIADNKRIIIPCFELIRFYFGSSSSLLNRLFTTTLRNYKLWKGEPIFDEFNSHLSIRLEDGISRWSAEDIGRIYRDKQAFIAARMIMDTCRAASVASEQIYPYTGFPFQGETTLVASGKWLSFGDAVEATFLVYRLESCSHPFPFECLTYVASSDKNSRSEFGGAKKSDGQDGKIDGQSMASKRQIASSGDPGRNKSTREYKAKVQAKFTDLAGKPVWMLNYDTVDQPRVIRILQQLEEDVGVGVGSGVSATRVADIVSHAERNLFVTHPMVPNFIKDGAKNILESEMLESTQVEMKLLTPPGYTHPIVPFSVMVDEDGVANQFSYVTDQFGGQRIRRAAFVECKLKAESSVRNWFIAESQLYGGSVEVVEVDKVDLERVIREVYLEMD